ncbi:hypothetical protein T492DRAFT_960604 [Pavlovales sp. CCMP2436]|nr:hypothetical protein T492DRAFT_960604 [Pavlovales sp. CCMP2436]
MRLRWAVAALGATSTARGCVLVHAESLRPLLASPARAFAPAPPHIRHFRGGSMLAAAGGALRAAPPLARSAGASMLAGAAISALVIGGFNLLGFAATLVAPAKAEKVTDLLGTGAIAASAIATFALSPFPLSLRKVLVTAAVVSWGVRLAGFLFYRVLRTGGDTRLEQYFETVSSMAAFWGVSALWGWLTALPTTLLCFSPAAARPLGPIAIVAAAVFCSAFAAEAVSDWQKWHWKQDPNHADHWCDVGLWSQCRHPNYASELTIWPSIFLLAAPGLVQVSGSAVARVGGVAAAALCPIFVALVILKVSGVPIAEARNERRFAQRPAYQQYKSSTPLLVPRFVQRWFV